MLRTLALRGRHYAGGDVGDAHGGLDFVDVLAAFAAGADRCPPLSSTGGMAISEEVSSISAMASTLAKLVWRRLLESKGEMRTRRWTPRSALQ